MDDLFGKYRKEIIEYISSYLSEKKALGLHVSKQAAVVSQTLDRLTEGGKTIRGSLLLLSHDMFGGNAHADAVRAAAAIELFESSVLIHDDIIDRDITRRGMPSIHEQFKQKAVSDPAHYGEGMAMLVGDIGLYWSVEMLSAMDHPEKIKIIREFIGHCVTTIFGEMDDVEYALTGLEPDEKDIFAVYKNKTSAYSFQIPLVCGSILAGQGETVRQKLGTLGENLGILFQMKDDELGVSGDPAVTGKPVGSDIREGKKTLYWLGAKVNAPDTIMRVFGKQDATDKELKSVGEYLKSSGIADDIKKKTDGYAVDARKLIGQLIIPEKYRNMLLELTEYLRVRKK